MRREKLLWKKKWTQFMKALPNRHKQLCLFKLGYDVHVLLSSVMYILSSKKITAVYPMSRRRWDQNTTQVANRLNRARATYVWLLHVSPWQKPSTPCKRRNKKYIYPLCGCTVHLVVHNLTCARTGYGRKYRILELSRNQVWNRVGHVQIFFILKVESTLMPACLKV